MKVSVPISRGIESLFGTRDENMRVLEEALRLKTRLLDDSLELEGESDDVARAEGRFEFGQRAERKAEHATFAADLGYDFAAQTIGHD